MSEAVVARFREVAPAVDFCSLRLVEERREELCVRQGVLLPPEERVERGAMITVWDRGGLGYAATSDLSRAGLARACARARDWAHATAAVGLIDTREVVPPAPEGAYRAPVARPWDRVPLSEKLEALHSAAGRLQGDERVVDSMATVMGVRHRSTLAVAGGGEVVQELELMSPDLSVVVHEAGETQKRTLGLRGHCQQGGWEVLERVGFHRMPERLREEALELLAAPNCPSGVMDVVIDPDQMMLQIHESIGHPLELDRILGDERNYAGTSFVTPEMFGSYRYGSELLDVTFDPTVPEEFASFAFDDDGTPATREYLIKGGILVRPLGGALSQARAGMPGVANSRAQSWNRPPIDRMANINLEAGSQTRDELIAGVERGVFLQTNCSWSIDDSRNKFQFGCEHGRLIEDGELKGVVKNPNYRGISATFWRSLTGVGDESTRQVLGTPYCGKGEPNQVIRVGHASPVCRFSNIDVFGGES